jgi:hypothetical protein
VVELYLNGTPIPASLLANIRYELEARVDGFDPISTRWEILQDGNTLSTGNGTIIFVPTTTAPYSIYVVAVNSEGGQEESVTTVNVTARTGAVYLGVNWDKLGYSAGEILKATLNVADPDGLPATSLAWTLYRNNIPIATGNSNTVSYPTTVPGVYRIKGTARDINGSTITGDSAVSVSGGFEIQACPIPPIMEPTCVYMGAVYTAEITGAGGPVTSLPYMLASQTQEIYLLPGTTHISFDLDPLNNEVDDEVVVRTATGNWAIRGNPTGLTEEEVGYDYLDGERHLPAPVGGCLRVTVEAFNVHGAVAGPFSFRVRVKCWRNGQELYEYTRCNYSAHPGGAGARSRKFAAIITEMDVQTDVETDLNRLDSTAVNRYTATEVTNIPDLPLNTSGAPNPVQGVTGMFFTASNLLTTYEPVSNELPELDARAVSAVEGIRPFILTLQQPATPPIIQRIAALRGRFTVYMAAGGLTAGSVITARIQTGKLYDGEGEISYEIPVETDVYNPNDDAFVRVGSIAISLEDYQFNPNGLVIYFDVNESAATPPALPCSAPDPVVAAETIITPIYSHSGVVFDGACYSNPVLQEYVDTEQGAPVGSMLGCQELFCGPIGTYCYTSLAGTVNGTFMGTATTGTFVQPLYSPAPYVSFGSQPLECYHNPYLLGEAYGTIRQSQYPYQTDALCGQGYGYQECEDATQRIAIIYPYNSTPHETVYYGSACWSRFTGTLSGSNMNLIYQRGATTPFIDVISVGSVDAVLECGAVECSGTLEDGSSIRYVDTQTMESQAVVFDLDDGIPYYAAAPQYANDGAGTLPTGTASVTFTQPRKLLFSVGESGQMEINLGRGLLGLPKKLRVQNGSSVTLYDLSLNAESRMIPVVAGDSVYLDVGNVAGLLSDRTRGKRTQVSWKPVVALPRVYHTVEVMNFGTTAVHKIGFTGQTDRSPYVKFETLPADVEQEFPNPDNIVTVEDSAGVEYVLIRTRAIGDPIPRLPGGTQWYAGQILNDTLTFRFYTTREDRGSHGEMDLWLDTDGAFPVYFRVDPYRTLRILGGDVDVLIMVSTPNANADAIRTGVAALHQKLLDGGSDPRYAFVKCQPTPLNTGAASGVNFRTWENFSALANWLDSSMPDNFGNPETGLTTIWASGTTFNWRDDARRLFLMINNFSAWDFPPGWWTPTSNENYTKAQATLAANPSILYSIINPTQNIPITPSTFVLPGNVPQTYIPLTEQTGGKYYLLTTFGTDPTSIAEDIGNSAQSQLFTTRVATSDTDVSRNALRKATNGTEFSWPYQYAAPDGERLVLTSSDGTVTYDGKLFTRVQADPGISCGIIDV